MELDGDTSRRPLPLDYETHCLVWQVDDLKLSLPPCPTYGVVVMLGQTAVTP